MGAINTDSMGPMSTHVLAAVDWHVRTAHRHGFGSEAGREFVRLPLLGADLRLPSSRLCGWLCAGVLDPAKGSCSQWQLNIAVQSAQMDQSWSCWSLDPEPDPRLLLLRGCKPLDVSQPCTISDPRAKRSVHTIAHRRSKTLCLPEHGRLTSEMQELGVQQARFQSGGSWERNPLTLVLHLMSL